MDPGINEPRVTHSQFGELHHLGRVVVTQRPTPGKECLKQCNVPCFPRQPLDCLNPALRKHCFQLLRFSLLATKTTHVASRRCEGAIQGLVIDVLRDRLEAE